MVQKAKQLYTRLFLEETAIYPLVIFRIIFGLMMAASVLRFLLKGWVQDIYLAPNFFFSYWGLDFIKPYHPIFIYSLFALMLLSALGIMVGLFYRWSATVFFITFTYVELIDKSTYLNHYYFVSLIAFLMIWLPAHQFFSLDSQRNAALKTITINAWQINIIKIQLGLVYFFAGLAKLNPDWMLEALPLKIWLPAHQDMPILGVIWAQPATAYIFSWAGAFYDLLIPFLLISARFRPWAYAAVVIFHLFTALLFPIGMFPYIMILSTLVFFSASFHQKIISLLSKPFGLVDDQTISYSKKPFPVWIKLFLLAQILLPLRFLLFHGPLFWTEQGYRFSWRVMLMEKAGYVTYIIKDTKTGKSGEIDPADYLTDNQLKMMATQPDMILQFAHFIKEEYQNKGMANPEIYAQSYVSLNGRGSRPFINPDVDLGTISQRSNNLSWVLPFEEK